MIDLPLGPGAFIPVVGPSGAGKDSLLNYVKQRLHACGDVHFARRVITRPSDPNSEAHDTLSEADFADADKAGQFALSWRSHGLAYGIPRNVDGVVLGGGVVVANTSRGVIDQIRKRYARVTPILITVTPEALANRLAARGRESADEIAARIARNATYSDFDSTCAVVDNSGTLETAGEELLKLVKQAQAGL